MDFCKIRNLFLNIYTLISFLYFYNEYKYNREIIVNLFRTPYQAEMINQLFLQSLGIHQQTQKPEPLYTMSYAGRLVFGDENSNAKRR